MRRATTGLQKTQKHLCHPAPRHTPYLAQQFDGAEQPLHCGKHQKTRIQIDIKIHVPTAKLRSARAPPHSMSGPRIAAPKPEKHNFATFPRKNLKKAKADRQNFEKVCQPNNRTDAATRMRGITIVLQNAKTPQHKKCVNGHKLMCLNARNGRATMSNQWAWAQNKAPGPSVAKTRVTGSPSYYNPNMLSNHWIAESTGTACATTTRRNIDEAAPLQFTSLDHKTPWQKAPTYRMEIARTQLYSGGPAIKRSRVTPRPACE